MSFENGINNSLLEQTLSRISVLCKKISQSIGLVLDFSHINTPIPPDHYSTDINRGRKIFTQADHDRLWEKVKDFDFTNSR